MKAMGAMHGVKCFLSKMGMICKKNQPKTLLKGDATQGGNLHFYVTSGKSESSVF